jgi:hypothetical protein
MTERRGSRFLLEVLFLAALAAALAFAHLSGLEVAGLMLVGWLIVAAFEWAAWRDQPHYGRGLPPRYYVPSMHLPPAQPLEQVASGYPNASRDEAPTWIAPPELRAEMLGEWPGAAQYAHDDEEDAVVDLSETIVVTQPVQRVARYTLDPLGDPAPKRRLGRGGAEEPLSLEVPARPEGARALPGRLASQD